MQKNKKGNKSVRTVKQMIALIGVVVLILLLISELIMFTLWGLPMIAIQMFQTVGISVESTVTVGSVSLSDMAVMWMMWLLPCLFVLGISIYLHVRLIKIVIRLCKRLFVYSTSVARCVSGEEVNNIDAVGEQKGDLTA